MTLRRRLDTARLPAIRLRRELARTAREVAAEVGGFVAARARPTGRRAVRKGEGDFVTAVDLAAEARLRRALHRAWPTHGFVGEESGHERADAEFVWVVDPIDGTSNYTQGLPEFGVAVACLWRGAPIAAAVACWPEDAVYTAAAGLGAQRDGRRLRVPAARLDDAAVVGAQWHRGGAAQLDFLVDLVGTGARIRVLGSTVVQLCGVAAGRLHANVQQQGRLWDLAAAALVVTEAGGVITRFGGVPLFPVVPAATDHYPTIAAPPAIHRRLVRLPSLAARPRGSPR